MTAAWRSRAAPEGTRLSIARIVSTHPGLRRPPVCHLRSPSAAAWTRRLTLAACHVTAWSPSAARSAVALCLSTLVSPACKVDCYSKQLIHRSDERCDSCKLAVMNDGWSDASCSRGPQTCHVAEQFSSCCVPLSNETGVRGRCLVGVCIRSTV